MLDLLFADHYYKTKSKEPKKESVVARPPAKELTERELEVLHVFWERGELTAAEIRDCLSAQGRELAYTTVATLIRILFEKEFLIQTNDQRPFKFKITMTTVFFQDELHVL